MPIVPDIGMFASFDPVALDMACTDAVNASRPLPGSRLAQADAAGEDHIATLHPVTHWRVQIEHAKKIGLGTDEYELITI